MTPFERLRVYREKDEQEKPWLYCDHASRLNDLNEPWMCRCKQQLVSVFLYPMMNKQGFEMDDDASCWFGTPCCGDCVHKEIDALVKEGFSGIIKRRAEGRTVTCEVIK